MLEKIEHWFLRTFCALCHIATKNTAFCLPCLQELPWQDIACTCCAKPLSTSGVCGDCLQNPPPYHRILCLFRYQMPIDGLILSLKFSEKLSAAKLLGDLMAQKIATEYADKAMPDCIIPVPLHATRLTERGYNQALEIARPVAKKLNIPLHANKCIRVLPTPSQASRDAEKRRKNMRNAFALQGTLQAKHVAIVDDVFTTGSTVAEMAGLLKKAGVLRIDVWCCARTGLHEGGVSA